ncbi:Chk1 protein kinase [Lecanora helva]
MRELDHVEGVQSLQPPPRLYERLAHISGYTWDESITPFHSVSIRYQNKTVALTDLVKTYDNWHVFGYKLGGHRAPSVSSNHEDSIPSSPKLDPRQRLKHQRTGSLGQKLAELSQDKSEGESEPVLVVARVSSHILRIEREFHLCRSFIQTSDPECRHTVQPLELLRLPNRQGDEPNLVVSIFVSPGKNYLKDLVEFGPSFVAPEKLSGAPLDWDNHDAITHDQISISTFLTFAIGACECLELLHHGLRVIHGELRADAFHYNNNTGAVKLINLGSGPRSFENGLTSSGWMALSREIGVKYKLQFIAPEQTGRMPAEPNSRTGKAEIFSGESPLDVLQAVLGRRIPLASSERIDVPDAISKIIQKMTQKQIDDRYHSTSGVKHDLIEVQRLLGEGDTEGLSKFEVALKDVSSFFVLPTTLLGREKERAKMVEIIERMAQSRGKQDLGVSDGPLIGSTSGTSTFSERLETMEAVTRSSDTSSQVGFSPALDSSSSGNTAAPQDSRPSSQDLSNGATPAAKPPLEVSNSKESIDTTASLDTAQGSSHHRPELSSNWLQTGSNHLSRRRESHRRVRRHRCELISITGAAGAGKSSLIQSTQTEIRKWGYLGFAKFDPQRKAPFEPLLRAMSSLFRQIFSESDVNSEYHNMIRKNIRGIWASVCGILDLPGNLINTESQSADKSLVYGTHSVSKSSRAEMIETGSLRTQSGNADAGPFAIPEPRANANPRSLKVSNIVIDVLRILSRRLICLCLDDINYADEESLNLISDIISKKLGVTILTTCREGPLLNNVAHLLKNGSANITSIKLAPLSEQEVTEYVANTLYRQIEYVLPLAIVCLEKSNGNPFYVRQMLETCHRKGCIWYSWKESAWDFDLDRVFAEFEGDSYDAQLNTTFITKRLQDLPTAARAILAWASLLGNTFSFPLIQRLMSGEFDYTESSKTDDDGNCIKNTDVFTPQPVSSVVEGLQAALQAYILRPGGNEDEFTFSHDRYITASASLRECHDTQKMHFIITQVMMKYSNFDGRSLYARAQHVCKAAKVILRRVKNRHPFRALLVNAAQNALESGARPTALEYYEHGLSLLQVDPWNENSFDVYYIETLCMYTKTAELYWHQGRSIDAENLIGVIFQGAHSASDKAPAWILQSKLFAQKGKMQGAFTALKTSLLELGLDVSTTPTWESCDTDYLDLSSRLQAASFTDIISKPLSSDRTVLAMGALLTEAISAGFWSNSLLFCQIAQAMVSTHLSQSATFPQAGLGFAYLAIIAIGRRADLSFGLQMHDISKQLLSQYGDSYTVGRGYTLMAVFLAHLCAPLQSQIDTLEEALDHAMVSGDKHTMLFSIASIALNKLYVGEDMADIESYCLMATEDFGDWQSDLRGGTMLTAVRQVVRSLEGKTRNDVAESVMSDAEHNTDLYMQFMSTHTSSPDMPRSMYNSLRLIPLYLYGHYEKALKLGMETIAAAGVLWSMRAIRISQFYTSLSLLAFVRENPSNSSRDEQLARVQEYRAAIVQWQTDCDINYLAWSLLIEAGLAEVEERFGDAVQNYEAACDHTEINDFHLEQALAFELLGEFYVRRGARRAARSTLQDARATYSRIGAFGKADQLAAKYEFVLRASSTIQTRNQAAQTSSVIGEIGDSQYRLEENDRQETRNLGKETAEDRTHAWASTPDPVSNDPDRDISDLGLDILDLRSILEFNQAISSELQIDRLLATMTEIILESAGAQADFAAVVIQGDSGGWCIAASGNAEGISTEPLPVAEIQNETQKQVLLYTTRFKEVVFVHNLAEDDRFLNSSGSVISIPILQGQDLLGVLYMQGQNKAFTQRNLGVLQLFVNQVGISIANALLFKRVAKVSAANQSMIGQQKLALGKAREAELKAKVAEAEAMENVRLKEEAVKAKSMFLANVSHELRTPLNGVIGMSELLKETPLDQDQAGFANNIKVCADTLLIVINDILDFSKLEAGKMKLSSVPINIAETIAEVVRALRYTNTDKDLKTITKLDLDTNLLVLGDPIRIHQIFMNLLSNSYKFTARGTVTVRARMEYETSESVTIICSVSDTGIGITQEQASRLFKPFSQADSSTQRSYGGSGLGLSICKALVDALDGKIWMESRLGQGTTVSFVIKFQKAATSTTANDADTPSESDPMATWSSESDSILPHSFTSFFDLSKVPRDELRVCIAEDNPINQKIAVSFVKKLGIKSEAFSDGQQAVEALRRRSKENEPFHLVLMDVQMPVLDGYNATRVIRKDEDPAVRGVLIIAMTASAIQGDREKCLEAGMNNYLAKPVRVAVLKSMLEDYLKELPAVIPDLQSTVTNLAKDAIEGAQDEEKKVAERPTRPSFQKRMSSKYLVPPHDKGPHTSLGDNLRPSALLERPGTNRSDSAVTVTQDDFKNNSHEEDVVPPLSLNHRSDL